MNHFSLLIKSVNKAVRWCNCVTQSVSIRKTAELQTPCLLFPVQYGIKKKEEKEAEAAAAMEQASEGSLTRPKKAVPTGCGDEEEEESIVDTVMKFIPAPLMDMFNKK